MKKPVRKYGKYGKKVTRAPEYPSLKKAAGRKKPVDKGAPEKKDHSTRLNKYISNAGICSRREADKLIENGEVKVNGKVTREMGFKVQPGDVVEYQGRKIKPEKYVYVLLNKPKNFITTMKDERGRKTVMELVENACEQRIYPVGRLDRATTGLLLFTNDGDLAQKLSHPSSSVPKIYQVTLDRPISEEDFAKIKEGTELEDGLLKVDDLAIVNEDTTEVGIKIHSGKNRVIRRLFEHYKYNVQRLDRVMYAGLDKKGISRGHWRFLKEKEVIRLKFFQ
jgi:23S rRNA pseudouridine2605 synthase